MTHPRHGRRLLQGGDIFLLNEKRLIQQHPDANLGEIARVLNERKIGAVVVVGAGGAVCGIASERDVVNAIVARGAAALDQPVADCMTANVVTCESSTSIDDLMNLMALRLLLRQ